MVGKQGCGGWGAWPDGRPDRGPLARPRRILAGKGTEPFAGFLNIANGRRAVTQSRVSRTRYSARLALLRRATTAPTGKSPKTCPALFRKIFRLTRPANHLYKFAPSRPDKRGGSRSSRNAGRDAVDARCAQDESACVRTAKSCGPDAPTLAASCAEVSARRRWQESPVTGESTK